MPKKVIILGGGVAGMSAAHELVERGFDVEVYERQPIPGGKARSIPVFESMDDHGSRGVHGRAIERWRRIGGPGFAPHQRRPWLPGEHGFRFFPGFYRHVIDTMDRIPYGDGKVSDNLEDTTQLLLARFDRDGIIVPSRFPRTLQGVKTVLDDFVMLVSGQIGVPLDEVEFFAARVWQIMTSCLERRLEEYEKVGWWEFLGAAERSEAYQKFFGHGITRSLVASQAQLASTFTIGNTFIQLLFDIADPSEPTSDRLLNGPTNVVWIRPWLNYLEAHGVRYHQGCTARSINCSGGTIRSVTVETEGRTTEVTGDYYIAALPIERVAPLVTQSLTDADPHLSNLRELAKNVEWMNGIQYYITRHVPLVHGHVIYIDSPWALSSVSQKQFWPDFDLSQFSDGDTRDILSVDISDWDAKGLSGKSAHECTREEIAREVWDQLKRSVNVEGRVILRDEDLDHWFLDPDIRRDPEERRRLENVEPLLVNLKDTWRLRPDAVTAIPNLFLASDYVRTFTDLATMEAANEAARRAVNGILEVSGSSADPCRLWKLHEPEILHPLREYDRARWEAGLPWDDRFTSIVRSVLEVVHKTGVLSPGGPLSSVAKAAPDPTGESSRSGESGWSEAENLVHVSKQILSMVEGGSIGPLASGEDLTGATGSPGSSRPVEAVRSTTANQPLRRRKIRIVQKPQ